MKIFQIRLFPDPVLRKKSAEVSAFDRRLEAIAKRMDATMRRQPYGIGLAAPQVGISLRIAIVDVSGRVPHATCLVLINPEILEGGGEKLSREGCMSLPDYTANLKRYEWIRLWWQDLKGNCHEKYCDGIEGICVQHEIDHLNGVLFMDRVTCLKTDMFPRERRHKKQGKGPA